MNRLVQDYLGLAKTIALAVGIAYASLMTYLGIDQEAFTLFAVLLVLDYITGVVKAKRLGHNVSSNKMKYGIISKLVLLFIPLALAILAKILGAQNYDFALYAGTNLLAVSEFYSIVGNIYAIRTKKELPEYDVVAKIGAKIRSYLQKLDGSDEKKEKRNG